MRRSSYSAFFGAGFFIAGPFIVFGERASSRAAPFLATVTPGDWNSECDVKPSERRTQNCVTPCSGRKQRDHSRNHEAKSHDRNDTHRERPACNDSRSIEKEPDSRNCLYQARTIENESEQRSHNHRRREAEQEFSSRPGQERHLRRSGLSHHRPHHDRRRKKSRREPDVERSSRAVLQPRDYRNDDRKNANRY